MKDIIMECSYYIVGLVCMVCVGEWTFHWTVRDWKRFGAAAIVYGVTIFTQFIPVNPVIPIFMLRPIGELLAWGLLCRGRVRDKLLRMIGMYHGVSWVELVVAVSCDFVTKMEDFLEMDQPISFLITMVIMACVTRKQWYQDLILYFCSLSKKRALLILGIGEVGMLTVTFCIAIQDMFTDTFTIIILRTLIIIELCIVAVAVRWMVAESYQRKYYQEQSDLKDEVIHTQQEYYQTIYEKDSEMRSFRHDISSHLGVLKILLERGENQNAQEQLKCLEKEFQQAAFTQVHVGDEVLDAILSMMNQKAYQKGILLNVRGTIQRQGESKIYELCTIISNAINNALEACERMDENGPVSLKILEHNETLCIIIENPGTEEMYQAINEGKSRKTDAENHGYGVQNIRRAVERLQGSLEYDYEDGRIKLEIYI